MSNNTFDDLMDIEGLEANAASVPTSPLFTVGKGPELTKWLTNTFTALMKRNERYFEDIRENLRLYRGTPHEMEKASTGSRLQNEGDPQLEKARNTKLYVNKIRDLVEFRVTTHNAAKPGIDIGPANLDYENSIGAKLAKAVVDSVWYQQDEDEVERTALRYTFIAGEHYVGTLWDPEKGDVNPSYVEWQKKMKSGQEKGLDIKDAPKVDGYDPDKPLRNGDCVYKHFPAWQVLPEAADHWSKVNYLFTWETEYVDVLKKVHSKKKDLINAIQDNTQLEGFDSNYLRTLRNEGKTIVIYVWHKRCSYLPEGRYIKCTLDGKILVDKELPYEHDELPLTRITDMDVPGKQRGESFISDVKGLQFQHYFLTSMQAANIRLFGYPKWIAESGSLQVKDLVNARNVIMLRPGAQKPFILQPQPTPPEVFNSIKDLDVQMDTKVKGAFSNPAAIPKRADSKAAFEYLDNKDAQRSHTMFSKVNKFRIDITRQTVKVCGQFYSVTDGRLVQIVGESHQYDLKHFDLEKFNQPYSYRIKEDSGFPQEKSARMEAVAELVSKLPEGTFTPPQILNLLDISSLEKLYDIGTKSLRAAESIIQDLLVGRPVPPPMGFEDLFVYWQSFALYIQDRQFKESVPEKMQNNVLDYLNAIEALMVDKAAKNASFAQHLTTLELFPLVFELAPTVPPLPNPSLPASGSLPAEAAPQEMPPEGQPQAQEPDMVHQASDAMQKAVAEHLN